MKEGFLLPDFGDTGNVQFHFEDTPPLVFPEPEQIVSWIGQIIQREKCRLQLINFIFCSDTYLHQINVQYLHHDTLTDVITFPYQAPPEVAGDIFISIDRIRENAEDYAVTFFQELFRVMIHGVLHLCGFSDKTPAEKSFMTEKEDEALSLLLRLEN